MEHDYIKREAALDAAVQYCVDDDGSCSKPNADLRELLDDIEAIPTDDVAPVRHGEWVQEHGIYCCSECKAVAPYNAQGDIIEYWPDLRFCYHCGAKMDKKSANGG